jgi:polysaccharide chain length determinant protein (PEP-CTERM system associated)
MSVEFRQRTLGEYARIIQKRKWLIFLPAIAIAAAVIWVVVKLPSVYESTTLLIVKPSTIPNAIVPTLSDTDLSMRINNIGQLVASRTSLEPLILKYDLYQQERAHNTPMELIVEQMRKDITVDVDKSRNDVTNAFKISYRERTPEKTRAVTSELASKYVNGQMIQAGDVAAGMKQFMEQQVDEAKRQLDEIDKQRLQSMMAHSDSQPSILPAMVGQLQGLREQQKSLNAQIGSLQDSRRSLTAQLNELTAQSQRDTEDVSVQLGDVKTSPAYGQLITRKAAVEGELANLLTQYKPQHPDVKQKQSELESVKREMKAMEDAADTKIEEIKKRRAGYLDPRVGGLKYNLENIDSNIKRQQIMLDESEKQIAEISARINSVPNTEIALSQLNNEYQTKKLQYDELLEKKRKADLSNDVTRDSQGETIQVVDPANMPQQPVAPKRLLLSLLGIIAGLGVGFACAAVFELPRLLTIQTKEDAEHYTGLPVLVSVPDLMTPQEARSLPLRRRMLIAAGVVATLVSIPALAFALRMTHLFDRFVS